MCFKPLRIPDPELPELLSLPLSLLFVGVFFGAWEEVEALGFALESPFELEEFEFEEDEWESFDDDEEDDFEASSFDSDSHSSSLLSSSDLSLWLPESELELDWAFWDLLDFEASAAFSDELESDLDDDLSSEDSSLEEDGEEEEPEPKLPSEKEPLETPPWALEKEL